MINPYFSDITESRILMGFPITFQLEEESREITINLPTIEEVEVDKIFRSVISLLTMDVKILSKSGFDFSFSTNGEFTSGLTTLNSRQRETIFKAFQSILCGLKLGERRLIIEGEPISSKEWDYILDVIQLSMGQKPRKEVFASEEEISEEQRKLEESKNMSAAEKRQQDIMKRLEEAKARKRNKGQEQKEKSSLTLSKIIIGVIKNFNLTIGEVRKMNYYAVFNMFEYTHKIDRYELLRNLYANGNLSEKVNINHWLD